MGICIDGVWRTDKDLAGTDLRASSVPNVPRNWVTADGSPGPTGKGGFKAEPGRFHLYVAWNCPWAHRTLIYRVVKRLEEFVSVSYANPARTDQGWVFDAAGEFRDRLFGSAALHDVYARAVPGFTGRVTTPLLFDTATEQVVNNESIDIIRMLNSAFADVAPESPDFYPEDLRPAIDAWTGTIQEDLNSGVYRTGFAETQDAYEVRATKVFRTLGAIEAQLATTPYLCGDRLTEADWRLLPTLVRFDVGYYSAFKCNIRRIADYRHLPSYMHCLLDVPGVRDTVTFDIYRRGYHSRSDARNPLGIVPIGPAATVPQGEPSRRRA